MHHARMPVYVALLLTISVPARADNVSDAKAASGEGQRLYESGVSLTDKAAQLALYRAAHEKFRLAYRLDPKPDYLFNIAQTARFQNDCPTALGAYKRVGELVKNAADKNVEMLRIVDSWVERLSGQCEPSSEFAATVMPQKPANEEKDAAIEPVTSPMPEAELDPEQRDAGPSSNRKAWVAATLGLTIVASGLYGYGAYEGYRTRSGGHFDKQFAEALAFSGYVGDPSFSNPCDDPGLPFEPLQACDDGAAAARRANLALVAGIGFTAAAGVAAYFAFFRQPGGASGDDETVVTSGPGDIGISVLGRF